jgi:hypothetical protein
MKLTSLRPLKASSPVVTADESEMGASSSASEIRIFREHRFGSDKPRLARPLASEPVRPTSPISDPSRCTPPAPGALCVVNSPSHTEPANPSTTEIRMIEILDTPAAPGETIEASYRRKEQEIGALLARLRAREALALHRRLTNATDPLALRFGRMTRERRERLLAFLADARRREACSERSR